MIIKATIIIFHCNINIYCKCLETILHLLYKKILLFILGINDLKTINHNATLAELGMDSVMAVEIKQVIESSVDIFLTANDMRNLTLASLAKLEDEGIIEPDSGK